MLIDALSDNSRSLDIGERRKAGWACDAMSWIIEDIPFVAGTGEGGGVIFPHGGVVLITKGRRDRYYPPLPGGKPPLIRRSVGAGAEADRGEALEVEGHLCPAWSAPPDETVVSTPAGFSACRKLLGLLAARMNAKVTERICSLSGQWGKVIRAKLAYTYAGSPGAALVTCWSDSSSGDGIFMKLDGCCGS